MAGNYEYPGKAFAWTKDPNLWIIPFYEHPYLTTTIIPNGFRLRSSLCSLKFKVKWQRIFSLKAWGKAGYR